MYDNEIYNNVIRNIPDPSDALHIEDGAAEENKVYSNKIVNSNAPVKELKDEEEIAGSDNEMQDQEESSDSLSRMEESSNPLSLHIR